MAALDDVLGEVRAQLPLGLRESRVDALANEVVGRGEKQDGHLELPTVQRFLEIAEVRLVVHVVGVRPEETVPLQGLGVYV